MQIFTKFYSFSQTSSNFSKLLHCFLKSLPNLIRVIILNKHLYKLFLKIYYIFVILTKIFKNLFHILINFFSMLRIILNNTL